MPRTKGRGAREQSRADRRSAYSELVTPLLVEQLTDFQPTDRVLVWGDNLVEFVAKLAPKVAKIVTIITAFEEWQAATEALSKHENVEVMQELAELDDPDDFPVDLWTVGVMVLPYQLGTKELTKAFNDFVKRIASGSPIYLGGSRLHEWDRTIERITLLIGPLEVLVGRDPVRVVRGTIAHRGGLM